MAKSAVRCRSHEDRRFAIDLVAGSEDALAKANPPRVAAASNPTTRAFSFTNSVGVPEEMLAGMRDAPFWPTLEQGAQTLVYDTTITSSLPLDRVSAITTPVLVLTSDGSDERPPTCWLRDTLPDTSLRTLEGESLGVTPEVLVPELVGLLTAGKEA